VVAGLEVGLSVILTATGFRLGFEDDGAVGLDGREGAGFDLGFGDHVDVGCDGGGAGGVEIGDGSAVGDDLDLVEAVAVDRIGAGVLAEASLFAVIRAGEVACVGSAGDEVEELDGAAAFDVEVLDLFVGDGVGLLAGSGGSDVAAFAGYGDGLIASGDGEGEAAEVELVVDVDGDGVFARGLKPVAETKMS
jgi:hypothetical protein